MRVSIVTPDKTYFEGEAASVVVPAIDGEVGILPRHAPLISRLGHGVARIEERAGAPPTRVAIYGGFLKVQDDVVTVLAGGAAAKGDETADQARQKVQQAQERVQTLANAPDTAPSALAEAQEQLSRARAYLQLLSA